MTLYCGGGFVTAGSVDYEDGDDVVDNYDVYDWEFDFPPPDVRPPPKKGKGGGKGTEGEGRGQLELGGEKVTRREESTREYPQFAKKYDAPIDLEKLKEALEWATSRADSLGTFRYDDIYDKAGEVAGVAFWVGFGPDVSNIAIHDALHDAFRMAGVDVAQTLIGMGNLRRGIERQGGLVKQSFFRIFVPHEGWKLLSDWTILREGESKADVRPELKAMVKERQRTRRLEIIEALKDIRVAEVHAAELAKERAAREAAEARARELTEELARQDRAVVAVAEAAAAPRDALANELRALLEGRMPAEWAPVQRAKERLARPSEVMPASTPPAGWKRAAEAAQAAGELAAERARQRPARPSPAPVAPAPAPVVAPAPKTRPAAAPPVKPARPTKAPAPVKPARPTAAERAAARAAEAKRLERRARYLVDKHGTASRTREANTARREARELRERAAKLKEGRKKA